nr:hypothetical protein CFP56_19395 [Quercus suber]
MNERDQQRDHVDRGPPRDQAGGEEVSQASTRMSLPSWSVQGSLEARRYRRREGDCATMPMPGSAACQASDAAPPAKTNTNAKLPVAHLTDFYPPDIKEKDTVSPHKPTSAGPRRSSLQRALTSPPSRTMSATQLDTTFVRNNQTGLSDSTHTSSTSSSAEKYHLDEFDTSPILLYDYRGELQTSSQKELCSRLDKDFTRRVTRKPIPRGTSFLEVKRHDLFLPSEKSEFEAYPNFHSSLASIKIPTAAYWSRLFLGNYQELYIVSPETSPNGSLADPDSRNPSPTAAWGTASETRED